MDWTDEEKLALAILKNPDADEQQWLAACQKLQSIRSASPTDLAKTAEMIVISFLSGFATIGCGTLLGVFLTVVLFAFTGTSYPFPNASSILWCLALLSSLLGFVMGGTKSLASNPAGLRTGLVIPIFSAVALLNIFGMSALTQMLGTWAYNIPLLSVFACVAFYRIGALLPHNAPIDSTEEKLIAKPTPQTLTIPTATSRPAITITLGETAHLLLCHRCEGPPKILGKHESSHEVRLSTEALSSTELEKIRAFVNDQNDSLNRSDDRG